MNALHRIGFRLFVTLILCLGSLPLLAGGGGQGFGFSFRAHGGISYLAAGDVNTANGGWFEYHKNHADFYDLEMTGGFSPVHMGIDVGAEAIVHLSARIGVLVGLGYLRSSRSATMTMNDPAMPDLVTHTARPMLSAMPIRLGLIITVPLAPKTSLTASAGGAYYAAVKYREIHQTNVASGYWWERTITAEMNRKSNVGFEVGLGIERQVWRNLFLFVEARGRYARLKNFDLAVMTMDSAAMEPEQVNGKIYLGTFTHDSWADFFVDSIVPSPPDPEYSEYREARFDFSGICLQTGFRIRL